jgi:hypothetical protein
VRPEGLGKFKKNPLIGYRTRDLPVCSIVSPPPGRYLTVYLRTELKLPPSSRQSFTCDLKFTADSCGMLRTNVTRAYITKAYHTDVNCNSKFKQGKHEVRKLLVCTPVQFTKAN